MASSPLHTGGEREPSWYAARDEGPAVRGRPERALRLHVQDEEGGAYCLLTYLLHTYCILTAYLLIAYLLGARAQQPDHRVHVRHAGAEVGLHAREDRQVLPQRLQHRQG